MHIMRIVFTFSSNHAHSTLAHHMQRPQRIENEYPVKCAIMHASEAPIARNSEYRDNNA